MNVTRNTICVTGKKSYLEMKQMKMDRLGDAYNPNDPILKDRETYVLSSTLTNVSDAVVITNLTEFLNHYVDDKSEDRDLFVLGGRDAFIEAMPYVSELIVTNIPGNYNCDRFFPVELLTDFDSNKVQYTIIDTSTHGTLSVSYYSR
jgi:dihydrofolate reductase